MRLIGVVAFSRQIGCSVKIAVVSPLHSTEIVRAKVTAGGAMLSSSAASCIMNKSRGPHLGPGAVKPAEWLRTCTSRSIWLPLNYEWAKRPLHPGRCSPPQPCSSPGQGQRLKLRLHVGSADSAAIGVVFVLLLR